MRCGGCAVKDWKDAPMLRVSDVDESEPVSIRTGCVRGANGIDQEDWLSFIAYKI